MNRTTDKSGNIVYTPRGYTQAFFCKAAAEHAEWLSAQLSAAKKPAFRVILPSGFWIACKSRLEAERTQAERGGEVVAS